ncbi:hypothetical protein E4T38_01014 [Aureobasidium subglaciale]|nr:hypothetical protein E4T38_01014 [Aureobasidium subglaciale]KAI5230791.1 hypothetical protein E4T40_01015 [Aureobasidium subglaciale]KAI5233751.1 hypothetical protein E4T41_01013 [Aureobasidium subglaciale]KAI5267354.1 hypothetical protein E4T46_01013 [Aureobasidium subglaciale]
MLSSSWLKHRDDETRRDNLYHGLAKMILDLAKVPLHRIGAWTNDRDGRLSLANGPLSDFTLFWNRHAISTSIRRDTTYASTELYIHDMLHYQDCRMRDQLNSIVGVTDGEYQLSALVGLRALLPHFWNKESRGGPFVFGLSDLHQSNIFVDEDWNITSIIDLEFASVVPVQMVQVPHWLTGRGVDQLDGDDLEEYKRRYDEFVNIVEREECTMSRDSSEWSTRRFWYVLALTSINAFPGIFEQHLQPRFLPDSFKLDAENGPLSRLCCEDVDQFIAQKLKDNEEYKKVGGELFAKVDIIDKGYVGPVGDGAVEIEEPVDLRFEVTQEGS